jgi:hypothetical protein
VRVCGKGEARVGERTGCGGKGSSKGRAGGHEQEISRKLCMAICKGGKGSRGSNKRAERSTS